MSKRARIDPHRLIVQACDMPDEMWQLVFAHIRGRKWLRWTCRQWRRCVYTMTQEVWVDHERELIGFDYGHIMAQVQSDWEVMERMGEDLRLYENLRRLFFAVELVDFVGIVGSLQPQWCGRLQRLHFVAHEGLQTMELSLDIFTKFDALKHLGVHGAAIECSDLVHLPRSLTHLTLELWGVGEETPLDLTHLTNLGELSLIVHDALPMAEWIRTAHPLDVLSICEAGRRILRESFTCATFNHPPRHLVLSGQRGQHFRRSAIFFTGRSSMVSIRSLELSYLYFPSSPSHDAFYRAFPNLEVLVENNITWDGVPNPLDSHTLENMRATLLPKLRYYGCVRPPVGFIQ
jgi:hypothetical protein